MIDEKLLKTTEATLKSHAKAIGLAPGSAEIFIKKSLTATTRALKKRKIVTKSDFSRTLTKELKKYHPDLAYVYENYDKII